MKFSSIPCLLMILLVSNVFGRATDTSESESEDSSRSSSSEELRYTGDESDLEKVAGQNATEVKDTETAEKTLEKFDKGLDEDKVFYVEKRIPASAENGTSGEEINEKDMAVMKHFNKSGEDSDENESKKNETVLGIDTFGAQGI